MAPSTKNLRKLLQNRFKNVRLEMFDGQGQLVLIITQFMIKMRPEDDEKIVFLKELDDLASVCSGSSRHSEEYRNFSQMFRSFMTEINEFFEVQNSLQTLINRNELVAVFIDLFLEILEEILRLQSNFILRVKDSIQTLERELKFLITFLGDTPSQSTELRDTTKDVLPDIEAVANKVGSFLHTFFFISDRISVTDMNQNLLQLLENLKLVKDKIIAHCNTNTNTKKLPSCRTQNTDVVSLFLVDSILDDLNNVMNHEDVYVKDQIEKVRDELMSLRSLLADMEVKRYSELEKFFIHIRDVAYEVEYVVSSFSPVLYLRIRLPQLIEKIMFVKEQFGEMKEKYDAGMLMDAEYPRQQKLLQAQTPDTGDGFGLDGEVKKIKDQLLRNTEKLQILLQTQTPDTGDIVGLEDEVTKITEQLIRDTEKLQSISIFGMPGLGKTTLAKKLYDDPRIVQRFDKRAWCVVSQNYRIRNILIDILMSMNELSEEARMQADEDELGEALYKRLSTIKRYIIVMDDIWDVDALYKIKKYIPKSGKGGKIVFTTRDKDVASEASSSAMVASEASSSATVNALKCLTDEECWDLLQRKVFQQNSCPENLIVTGREIARKCDGLPLAVVVIAAVLSNMEKEPKLWEDVAERISSYIAKESESNKYKKILELSYNYLPPHLKPCYLYLGTFEEDREIDVRKLILRWIAEGFIEKVEKKSKETVAQMYLEHLINRSLVQVAQRRPDGGVKSCRIHDLLREMCLRIAKEYKFMKVIQNQLSIYEQYRRLSIHSRSIASFSRPFGLHVRSLSGHLPDPSTFIFGNLKLLKVLDLSSMDCRFYNSTRVEHLVLLRFLAVSSIPSSIERFENLEFLFVNNSKTVEIPENLFNIVKLRRVYFSGGAQFSQSWRERAAKGETFPESSLHTISSVSIDDENDEKILRFSPNLRRLKCRFSVIFDSSENNYRYPVLNFLDQLESLSVSFIGGYAIEDPSPDLTNLPLNLRRLTLSNFNLSLEQMKIIGNLVELEVLKLRDGTIEENSWDTSEGEFQKLKFLELDGVQIEEWNASSDHFPKLERLVLRSCQLSKIPSDLGQCLSLRKIEVRGCKKSVEDSARSIKEEQEDYSNYVELDIYHS